MLRFGIEISVRYHGKRQRYYEALDTLFGVVTIVGSSGAAASFLTTMSVNNRIAAGLSIVAALAQAVEMVTKPSHKAKLHAELRGRFIDLDAKFERAGTGITEEEIRKLAGERREIERQEPPELRVLEAICHNEATAAFGGERMVSVAWWQEVAVLLGVDLLPSRLQQSRKPKA